MRLDPDYPVLTPRLALRPLGAADVDALLTYRSREDVCRYVPFSPQSREELLGRIDGMWARTILDEEGQSVTLGVELRSDGLLIGDVVLFWHSRKHLGGEIGYVIDPRFSGHGYVTEASNALLRMGFHDLGLRRIVARIDARNEPSIAVARRLGMRQEAHLVQNELFKGEWSDEIDFAILADEWASLD